MAPLRLALAQVNSSVGDLDGNATRIRRAVTDAASAGAEVVVLPEMALPGYPVEDLALRGSFQRAVADRLDELAGELASAGHGDIAVVVGSLGTTSHNHPTNTAAVLRGGEVTQVYVKHHLPSYGVFDEYRIFRAGDQPVVLEVRGRRLGLAICEDIWQTGGPVSHYSGERLDALLVINGSPFEHVKRGTRQEVAAQRAREVAAPVAYVNLVGSQDDLVFDGASFVTDATGVVVATAPSFTEHLLLVDLDDGGVPSAVHDADRGTKDLDPTGEMYDAVTLGLADYVRKNGFARVVLGLSGGIDSALVAVIACDAIGASNVIAVSMPSGYSSQHSRDDAEALAEATGLDYRVQPIAPMVDAFQGELELTGIAEENLQARVRGVVLMAISNAEGPLVLAPGNKSELSVGYSTIYGDAVGGYAPLKDVSKTHVWELARWRNAQAESLGLPAPIPSNTITKAPSAELRPGQQDSDSLPEYEVLDRLLDAHIAASKGRGELIAEGFEPDIVDQVLQLVGRAEWKRRQFAPGPKVTPLAFGRDRRLPITSAWQES
ncbi:NAD+ synthase [Georgenia sp. MJ170]|uniref:NAD+ synthase n=1 Tax=Georgenia sunbinii TaxID=3117728 RepID=UPI002F263B5F